MQILAGCAHPESSVCAPTVRTTTVAHITRPIHPPCLPGSSLCAPTVRTTTAFHTTRVNHPPCPPGTTGARCEIGMKFK